MTMTDERLQLIAHLVRLSVIVIIIILVNYGINNMTFSKVTLSASLDFFCHPSIGRPQQVQKGEAFGWTRKT